MNDKIMVSICCATYNHEKYLRKALNSALMQEVNFKYEIIIAEDCSTDNSRAIIKKYERQFPDVIKALYRESNMGALDNIAELFLHARGKYVVLLETDDFWTDKRKLQKQVDFLEDNPDFVAVACKVHVVDKNDKVQKKIIYPECKKRIYSHRDYRLWLLPGQTETILYRNIDEINNFYRDDDLYRAYSYSPGDRIKILAMLDAGKIYCMPEKMGAYRYVADEGTSFSATYKLKFLDYMKSYLSLREYVYKNDMNVETKKSADFLLFEAATAAFVLQKAIGLKEYTNIVRQNKYIFSSIYWFFRHSFKKGTDILIDKITGETHL